MSEERDYHFVAKTYSAPELSPDDFLNVLRARSLPPTPRLSCGTGVAAIDVYHQIGQVELQTDDEPGRSWEYCLVQELESGVDLTPFVDRAANAAERNALASAGITCLSSELMVRPKGAGTAIPCPSKLHRSFPQRFTTAIEYINIPDEHWDDYKLFMRDVFGPIGSWLVTHGHSYKVTITERVESIFRDPSLPDWNRLHLLTGDFESQDDGFFKHVATAVAEVVGKGETIETALSPASAYRRKPRMSNNRIIFSSRAG
jgi:hypothetical protein